MSQSTTKQPAAKAKCRPPRDEWISYEAEWVPIGSVTPSPENPDIYGDGSQDDQSNLVDSIRHRGLAEPILVSADSFVMSGHRRYSACQLLGWTHIPIRRSETSRADNPEYHRELIEYNPQRIKTVGSLLREALLRDNDILDTYAAIHERREASMTVDAEFMDVGGDKGVRPISDRRLPFLKAVQDVINELKDFWPLSIRQIHYRLLNAPPLKQLPKQSKFDAEHYRYRNDCESYNSLVNLLLSARYRGQVAMTCIDDPTRPQKQWHGYTSVSDFVRSEVEGFLVGYDRDRQQDQPRHIEVFGEKSTLYRLVERACAEYYVPFSIGRGFCSTPVWRDIANRFRESGKERMTLIIVSDHDPAGFELADDAIRSLRDLWKLPVDGHRVAVTREQIDELDLAKDFNPVKEDGAARRKFVERTGGDRTWEVEALAPDYLVERIKAAVQANMDMTLYRRICADERSDCQKLANIRKQLASKMTV